MQNASLCSYCYQTWPLQTMGTAALLNRLSVQDPCGEPGTHAWIQSPGVHAEPERVSCQGEPGPVLGQRAVCADCRGCGRLTSATKNYRWLLLVGYFVSYVFTLSRRDVGEECTIFSIWVKTRRVRPVTIWKLRVGWSYSNNSFLITKMIVLL